MSLHLESDAPTDFDFIIGDWEVRHERLSALFCGATDWIAFEGRSSTIKTLGGFGNLEDNILDFPAGAFRAVAMRSYCKDSGIWTIWWLDGRNPTQLDTPVSGSFKNGIGTFFAEDVIDGVPTQIRFTWDGQSAHPRWDQAFSQDGGVTWETNWRMEFIPA